MIIARAFVASIAVAIFLSAPAHAQDGADSTPIPEGRLTIDDVLQIIRLEQAEISPTGEYVALTIQRPATVGEQFGRNAYEIDPSRNDGWIYSVAERTLINLTGGSRDATGYWCAQCRLRVIVSRS